MPSRRITVADFDIKDIPIGPILQQAASADLGVARQAWKFLGMLAREGRPEAGIFLLGLSRVHGDDLESMAVLVEELSSLPSEKALQAVSDEFHRVPSTPSTRTYLNSVLKAIQRFPPPLAARALEGLSTHPGLSEKWRLKFREALWSLGA